MRFRWQVALLATAALFARPTPPADAQPDHFTCYKAKTTSGTLKFVEVGVTLVDRYRSSTATVKAPKLLCAPTDKNDEDPTAPSHPDHLEDYKIKPTTKFTTAVNQKVDNQFGTIFLDVKKPIAIQVPTAKSLVGNPAEPVAPAVDHFTCYKTKVTSGTPKFLRVNGLPIEDQFGAMTVDVMKPSRLCVATNKNNEEPGAQNHPDHLLCYKVRQTSLPKFTARLGLFTNNQFGPERLDAKKPKELCVPSFVTGGGGPSTPTPTRTPTAVPTATPPPNCGNAALDPGEQCDGAIDGACNGAPCTSLCTCGCFVALPIPDRIAFVNRPTRDSDTGWTGISHDLPGDDEAIFNTMRLSNCDTNPASPTCGVCDFTGPVAVPGPAKNCFCWNVDDRDTSSFTVCNPEAPSCANPETCECIYGPPLPLTTGGVSACVVNRVAEPIVGTINIAEVGPHAGESKVFLHLDAAAHTSPTQAEACPRCLGDPTPRDGVKTGTCTYGTGAGQPCDVSGDHDIFGTLSYDCLPLDAANIGNLQIIIPNQSTGTTTLTPAVPCSAPGFVGRNCPCDTCATLAAEPCMSNADCPGGAVCGGKRCIGGSNAGAACVTNSSCPGGGCAVAGAATATNACEDTVCSPDSSDPASPNDGVCHVWPVRSVLQRRDLPRLLQRSGLHAAAGRQLRRLPAGTVLHGQESRMLPRPDRARRHSRTEERRHRHHLLSPAEPQLGRQLRTGPAIRRLRARALPRVCRRRGLRQRNDRRRRGLRFARAGCVPRHVPTQLPVPDLRRRLPESAGGGVRRLRRRQLSGRLPGRLHVRALRLR